MKLGKIIMYLRVDGEIKQYFNLINLVFFIIIYIHCFACLWWFIVKYDEEWIPPKYTPYPDSYKSIYDLSIESQYINCLYMATQVFGGVDQQPRDSVQTWLISLGLMLGAVINANIFGELTVIMASLDKANKIY